MLTYFLAVSVAFTTTRHFVVFFFFQSAGYFSVTFPALLVVKVARVFHFFAAPLYSCSCTVRLPAGDTLMVSLMVSDGFFEIVRFSPDTFVAALAAGFAGTSSADGELLAAPPPEPSTVASPSADGASGAGASGAGASDAGASGAGVPVAGVSAALSSAA